MSKRFPSRKALFHKWCLWRFTASRRTVFQNKLSGHWKAWNVNIHKNTTDIYRLRQPDAKITSLMVNILPKSRILWPFSLGNMIHPADGCYIFYLVKMWKQSEMNMTSENIVTPSIISLLRVDALISRYRVISWQKSNWTSICLFIVDCFECIAFGFSIDFFSYVFHLIECNTDSSFFPVVICALACFFGILQNQTIGCLDCRFSLISWEIWAFFLG